MSGITTHVLDTTRGRPAAGVPVTLEFREGGTHWVVIGRGVTGGDGRLTTLTDEATLESGTYRLTFHTDVHFRATGTECFFPEATVTFVVADPEQHYHVPLLLSPYGYSTYRGS